MKKILKSSMNKRGIKLLLFFTLIIETLGCEGQKTKNMLDTTENKKFSCDIETGECGTATEDENTIEELLVAPATKVKMIYYTDPICSACWAIEPELKKFKLVYGDFVEIEYKMGGLLPKWDGFVDRANGISKPADVAGHWDEVGAYTGMSIDGDIWLEDPLHSSYPPSIAFKAMQKQGDSIALEFLRKIREMLFLEKKNITKEEYLIAAVKSVNGDTTEFLADYKNNEATQRFNNDLNEMRSFGVRGFPTFIFFSEDGKGYKISGTSGYNNYALALTKAKGSVLKPKAITYTEKQLVEKFGYLSTKEISVILSQSEEKTLKIMKKLAVNGEIIEEKQKFCSFWRAK